MSAAAHRDYTFLGTTQSLCPECLAVIPAKIVSRNGRVYFRKRCAEHGPREDYVCSDVRYYDQLDYSLPAKLPRRVGVTPNLGCPYDCGLCTEHEQHTCIGLLEITSSCNLRCPMCFASSGPNGEHLSLELCRRAIDRLVEVEGQPEVLQLSGGEPTIHPEFQQILEYAVSQPIDYVMINTNGIRFAHDRSLLDLVAKHRSRVEVYFQLDGLNDAVSNQLRGESLTAVKLKALDDLGAANIHVTLAVTLQGGVNEDQIGPLIQYAVARPWITAISFQPATYSGRFVTPERLEQRITFPDVIKAVAEQTNGMFHESDFMPLPCAHPNCHSIAYAYRNGNQLTPFSRFIDIKQNLDLLANGITFTRAKARDAISILLGRQGCCGGDCGPDALTSEDAVPKRASKELPVLDRGGQSDNGVGSEFFAKMLDQQLGARDVFRITITSFLDAYNFDLRRLMKCCTHHVLPSGHIVPFCAYNVLYRTGHVKLPSLDSFQFREGELVEIAVKPGRT